MGVVFFKKINLNLFLSTFAIPRIFRTYHPSPEKLQMQWRAEISTASVVTSLQSEKQEKLVGYFIS